MALKMTVNLDNGITIVDSYIKINSVGGNKNNCTIELNYYVNETYADDKYVYKKHFNFVPNISDVARNFIKQGYEHLKTLDEFKDAIDVLEPYQSK